MDTQLGTTAGHEAGVAGRPISWSDLPPRTVLLMMQTAGAAKPQVAAASAGRMRQVIVDGILMELPEEVILGQIRNGTFIVVYPGTNVPWEAGNDRHPTYPPDWVRI